MNYEEVSNFEINKRVAISSGMDLSVERTRVIAHVHSGKGNVYIPFNQCSNPYDAWPIIVKNKISVIADSGRGVDGESMACDGFWVTGEFVWNVECRDKNPLRAQ